MSDRLRAAAQRALESLDDLIANTTDPGVEALGARYELAAMLSNAGPVVPRRRHRDVETDEQRTDRLETERDHAAGDHEYCGVECETEFPSDMLRNGILARAIPGSTTMLDELLRRAALPAPALAQGGTTADKAAAAGMTPTDYRAHSHRTAMEQARTAARGMYFEAGARVLAALDGIPTGPEAHRPLTEYIAEVQEVDGVWMYLKADPDRSVIEKRRAGITRRDPDAKTRAVRKTTTYTVEPDPAPAGEEPVVAYRAHMGGFLLRCLNCAPSPYLIRTGEMVPVTSEDLPDGGICTAPDCGRDVLARN